MIKEFRRKVGRRYVGLPERKFTVSRVCIGQARQRLRRHSVWYFVVLCECLWDESLVE